MDGNIISLLIGIVLIAIVGEILVSAFRNYHLQKLGIEGEKKVAKKLKKYASLRNYKVINDLYLPLHDKTTQIDHVLIGFAGILVIETKNLGGDIYGDPSKKEWTHIIGQKKYSFYNPLLQNQTHIDCIRHILGKAGLYNVNIESLVVFTNKKVNLYVPNGLPIIHLKKLNGYLKQPRFTKDKGFDVEKHYDALMNAAITDKSVVAEHRRNVKEMAKHNR